MLRVTIETDAEDVQGLKELLAMELEQRFGCRVRVVEIERIRKKEGKHERGYGVGSTY